MKLPLFFLFLYAITFERWLDVGIASLRFSNLVAVIFILSFFRETLAILKAEANVFIIYIYIILAIVMNDLYVQANTSDILISIFFHIISMINFIFFFSLFSKNDFNFPKFCLVIGFSLLIYKNEELFFTSYKIVEENYFQARISGAISYLAIGISFFLIHKSRTILAYILLLSTFLLFFNTGTRSLSFIIFSTLIMFYYTGNVKIKFHSFFLIILLSTFFIMIGLFLFKSEIINTIIVARIDTFSSLMHFFNTFPVGIGSGGIVNLLPYRIALSNFFEIPLALIVDSASNLNYSTAHSFVVGALFKHGLLPLLPIIYFLFNIFNLNIKMITYNELSNELRLISIFIFCNTAYHILFSGYGIFLIEFPIFYAATLAMYRRIKF